MSQGEFDLSSMVGASFLSLAILFEIYVLVYQFNIRKLDCSHFIDMIRAIIVFLSIVGRVTMMAKNLPSAQSIPDYSRLFISVSEIIVYCQVATGRFK